MIPGRSELELFLEFISACLKFGMAIYFPLKKFFFSKFYLIKQYQKLILLTYLLWSKFLLVESQLQLGWVAPYLQSFNTDYLIDNMKQALKIQIVALK